MLFEKSDNKILQNIRKRIGKIFSKLDINPNTWTLLSLFFAVLAAISLFNSFYLTAAVLIIISGLIDLIDGAVARETKKTTIKGAYLDTVIDRYNEFLYYFPLIFMSFEDIIFPFYFWILLLVFGSMMTTYAKSAASEKGIKKEVRGGLLERAERVGLYVIGLLVANFSIIVFQYIFVLIALLANISAIQRIIKAIDYA
jgi:archaetidylinositol phosphate synthase